MFIISCNAQDTLSTPPNSNLIIPALNFKDTDIRDIVRGIAFEYETNITIDNDISKRISIALFNLNVFDAVKIIATDNGFEFKYNTERFIISKAQVEIPPPPVENIPEVTFTKGKLSVILENVKLDKFIEALRKKTAFNFLITSGTTGNMTGVLKNIEFETGLKNLFQNNGFLLTSKDSIYYISKSAYFSSISGSDDQSKSPYWLSATGNSITLDANQVQLDRVLNDLANQMGLQIVKLVKPEAQVSVKCNDVTLKQVLKFLFKGTKFSYKFDKGAIIIGSAESKELEITKLLKLNYLQADKLKEKLPAELLKSANVNVSLEHNALIVTGNQEDIDRIENYVAAVDQPVPQVLIEALVVDYNLDKLFQLGVNIGRGDSTEIKRSDNFYPGINATASGSKINKLLNDIGSIDLFGKEVDVAKLGKLPNDFYINIRALEQNGVANVRSKPVLSTLNGHTASLKIGTTQNYVFTEVVPIVNATNSTFIQKETLQQIEANISFEITPWVGPNGEMTLEIKPDFETPVGTFSPDKKLIPAINKRSLVSTVRLKDGETIILGGLIQESETSSEEKVPLLGDIPLIGELFKNRDSQKSKGELLIYLTPKIFYGDNNAYTSYSNSK